MSAEAKPSITNIVFAETVSGVNRGQTPVEAALPAEAETRISRRKLSSSEEKQPRHYLKTYEDVEEV